jgi:hypothetical protein
MGISLTGLTPATTYDALIKVGDNGPIDGTLKVLSDGLGTNLPMEASTTGINFTGNLTQSGTALQPVLVSGTNIKTINSTSILGSGNIAVVTSPSGVSGAIQFSNGSAFASDAANFFWDDTNNRLGVGTNAPSATAHFKGSGTTSSTTSLLVQNSAGTAALTITDDRNATFGFGVTTGGNIISGANVQAVSTGYFILQNRLLISSPSVGILKLGNNNDNDFNRLQFGGTTSSFPSIKRNGTAIDFRLADDSAFCGINAGATTIKGSGSTSATTSLLVQNSAGTQTLKIQDDGTSTIGTSGSGVFTVNSLYGFINMSGGYLGYGFSATEAWTYRNGSNVSQFKIGTTGNAIFNGTLSLGNGSDPVASAQVEITSTTKGFLPPRMTTTQKNAIASPAAGLVVYDSTTNKLCCYNGSTWNDLF